MVVSDYSDSPSRGAKSVVSAASVGLDEQVRQVLGGSCVVVAVDFENKLWNMLVRKTCLKQNPTINLFFKHVFYVSQRVFRFFNIFTSRIDWRVNKVLPHILAHHNSLESIRTVLFRFRVRQCLHVVVYQ